ncbi:MAG: helix-turn-helix domain-containing protein [Chloroflexota bacterium]|nr:MAG: hypothetical protein DLM70_04250 [Chloroflexota bacterium]
MPDLRSGSNALFLVWEEYDELGQRTGLLREDVTRYLARIKEAGLIDFEPHTRGIRVLDRDALASAGSVAR